MSSLRLALKQSLQDATSTTGTTVPSSASTSTTMTTTGISAESTLTTTTTTTAAAATANASNDYIASSSSTNNGNGAVLSSSTLFSTTGTSTAIGDPRNSSSSSSDPVSTAFHTTSTSSSHHHRHQQQQQRRGNKLIRQRQKEVDDDHQSSSSEENEASLNDLDDHSSSGDSGDSSDDDDDNHNTTMGNATTTSKFKDRTRIITATKSNNMIKQHHHRNDDGDAAAHRIQQQFRKTKKRKIGTTTARTTTDMTSSSTTGTAAAVMTHSLRTKAMTKKKKKTNGSFEKKTKRKKKRKKEPNLSKSSSSLLDQNRMKTAEDDTDNEEEEEFRLDMSTTNDDHNDDVNDDEDESCCSSTNSSGSTDDESTTSWTVTAPSETIIRHMASLSNVTCVENIVPGLRVKVLFDNPIPQWYGGYIEQIYDTTTRPTSVSSSSSSTPPPPPPQILRKIKIAYDDGTTEMTHFPDRKPTKEQKNYIPTTTYYKDNTPTAFPVIMDTIVIDAVQNGKHMTLSALEVAHQIYKPSIPQPSMTSTTRTTTTTTTSQPPSTTTTTIPLPNTSPLLLISNTKRSSTTDQSLRVEEPKPLKDRFIPDDNKTNECHFDNDKEHSIINEEDTTMRKTDKMLEFEVDTARRNHDILQKDTLLQTTACTDDHQLVINVPLEMEITSPQHKQQEEVMTKIRPNDDDLPSEISKRLNEVLPKQETITDVTIPTPQSPKPETITDVTVPAPISVPFSLSLSSFQQQRPHQRDDEVAEPLLQQPTQSIADETVPAVKMRDALTDVRTVEPVDVTMTPSKTMTSATLSSTLTKESTKSTEQIEESLPPPRTENVNDVTFDVNDTKNSSVHLADTPSVTTPDSNPLLPNQGKAVALDQRDKGDTMLLDPSGSLVDAMAIVLPNDNKDITTLPSVHVHELEKDETTKISPPEKESTNTIKETDILVEEVTMRVEKDHDESSSKINVSEHHHDTIQLEGKEQPTSAVSNVEMSSVQDKGMESDDYIVGERSNVSTDIATSVIASTMCDDVATVPQQHDKNDSAITIVNDFKLDQFNGSRNNENEPHVPLSTTGTITSPTDTIGVVKESDVVLDDGILSTSTSSTASITASLLKIDESATRGEKDEKDTGETIREMHLNEDSMDYSNITTADIIDDAIIVPDLSVKIKNDPRPNDVHDKNLSLGSDESILHGDNAAGDTVFRDAILGKSKMLNTDEMMSERKAASIENVITPKESESSKMPDETGVISYTSEKGRIMLPKIDDIGKGSNNVPPPPSESTGSIEGVNTEVIAENQLENKSLTNQKKRSLPNEPQTDEPPKKKLTIHIPIHKMTPKPSGAETVTTPKSIHIHASGFKSKTEAKVKASPPSQQAMDLTSNRKDAIDTSNLSPRQLQKMALKLERKRQKMMAQKSVKGDEVGMSRHVVADQRPTKSNDTTESSTLNESHGSDLATMDNAGPIIPLTTDTVVIEENKVIFTKTEDAIGSKVSFVGTSEENASKKKKKVIRRKVMEGDSDPKSSKENELELDDSQWVQCDECGKWRIIPTRVVEELPKQWFCRDNVYDPKHSSCDAPEQTDKEVAREKKRRLKKKQRLLKTTEEAAAASAASATSHNHEPETRDHESINVGENVAERSPRPRDVIVDIDKAHKQQKRVSSMEESQLFQLPLTSAESRPPKKEKKLTSTMKKGRSIESIDKLVPLTEEIAGSAATANATDAVKPRGRGRPRRANNTTGSSTNTNTAKESIPTVSSTASMPTTGTSTTIAPATATDDGENLEWVQCEKCDKWRKLPPHVSADDLPDVWTCNMNTWNPSAASCDAPEDKSDGLQDIGVFGTNGSVAGKLTYRHLIFGSNGRKANRPISEKTCAAESIFSAHFDEDEAPTKVLYADSSAYISRGRPNISNDENDVPSVFELMSHSKLWQELRGISESSGHQTPSLLNSNNNERLRMNAYTYDTLPTEIQGPMKECVLRALDADTLSGDDVVKRIHQQQQKEQKLGAGNDTAATIIDQSMYPYCTTTVIVTTLCDLVKIGTVECIGSSLFGTTWCPQYRRKVPRVTPIPIPPVPVASASPQLQKQQHERRRLSFPMKLSKPWKRGQII